jgi:hypothetical protein
MSAKYFRPRSETIQSEINATQETIIIPNEDILHEDFLISENWYRYIVLLISACMTFANGFQRFTFTPIDMDNINVYNFFTYEDNLMHTFYVIIYVIMTLPSLFVIEKRSLVFSVKYYF